VYMYYALTVLAAEPSPTASTTGTFLQYGAIGAMLIVLGFFARTLIVREQARADRLEEDNKRLNLLVQDKIIPALINATTAIQASQQLLQAIQTQRELDERVREERRRSRGRDEEA